MRRQLRLEHGAQAGTLYRDELGICLGETRMDLAAINGQISGYEIKSDRDRIDRLARQMELYGRVVDTAVLVTEERFASRGARRPSTRQRPTCSAGMRRLQPSRFDTRRSVRGRAAGS